MKELIQRIKQETPKDFDFDWLHRFVRSIDLEKLDLEGAVPPCDASSGNYARNILLMDPFEVVLLHWPPGVESAIHHHEGFWGHVLCVEGEVENVEFVHDAEARELRELRALRVRRGGILPEPDGTIHKIANADDAAALVTLHFYAPALESLDGMVLYDAERQWRGELNERATTASFHQDEGAFRSLEKDAFTFVPLGSVAEHGTHQLYPVIPKPSPEEITESLREYYAEQADEYDALDEESAVRKAYTEGIDRLIAADLAALSPRNALHIACGTGRRAATIRRYSGLDYNIEGIDISHSMVAQARQRGIEARIAVWNEVDAGRDRYDAVTLLYAFGHIPSEEERRRSLRKVSEVLRPGGRFYMDVFNVENPKEWGPEALHLFEELKLEEEGYESGDLFYRRHEGRGVAFLHYCTPTGIAAMVEECGLRIVREHRIGYTHRPGETLSAGDPGGNLLLVMEKAGKG